MHCKFNTEFFVPLSFQVVCALGLCAFLAGCDSAGVNLILGRNYLGPKKPSVHTSANHLLLMVESPLMVLMSSEILWAPLSTRKIPILILFKQQ